MSEWNNLPNDDTINKLVDLLKSRNIDVVVVESRKDALEKVKSLIPEGSEVATGSSTTLNQIGFMDFLQSSETSYDHLSVKIWAESDPIKRNELRKAATGAEYLVTSVNAITEDGKLVAVDASGSRVGAIPFAADHVIVVSGTNKIVKDLSSAFSRIKEHVFPLEDKRALEAYGAGSSLNKWVILEGESEAGRTTLILIKEELGF